MFKRVLNRKEQEERVKGMNRLPPGQSLTEKFPVLHYGPTPQTDLNNWDLRVFGEVEEEVVWDWEAFNKLPRTEVMMDIHCVTRWSKFDTHWSGVRFNTLIEAGLITLKPSANFILQHAENSYTTNMPIELVRAETFVLATHFTGEPITPDHGFPLRGLVGAIPGRNDLKDVYLWKGAKWLRGLEILQEDQPGFWEQAGYHNQGDIWKEQRQA